MTIDIKTDLFAHSTTANRVSTVAIFPDGGMRLRVKNPSSINVDEFSYADRVKLTRFLLQGLNFHPHYRLADFAAGIGGPNEPNDRLNYVESFGKTLWRSSSVASDLQTWINHDDSSRLDGKWGERVKEYYAARGFPG